MAKYTLALCAAAVIITDNIEGDRNFVTGGVWTLNTGDLDILGEAYTLYEKMNERNQETSDRKHPLAKNRAVRSSIANTADGQEMFSLHGYLNFPCISNAWGRVFILDENWRDIDAIKKRVKDGSANTREVKIVECVNAILKKK